MGTLTEGKHNGEFIGQYAMGIGYHADEITLQSGDLSAGHILAKLETGTPTATAGAPFSAGGGTVGNGAVTAVSADAGALPGLWQVEIVGAAGATAAFKVIRPDGSIDGQGAVGTAYNGSINFSIADGATDWGPNMIVPITVAYGGDQTDVEWVEWDPAATTSAKFVAGILIKNTDASDAPQVTTAFVRGPALVNINDLSYKSGLTTAQKKLGIQQLLKLGIKAA